MAHDLYAQHIEHLDAGYQRALEAAGFDAVVVHAGVPLPKSPFDDQFWPFEPVPAFAHWAPVAWPGSAVLVRRGQAPVLFAHREDSFWEAPVALDLPLLQAGLTVEVVTDDAQLRRAVQSAGKVAFIGHEQATAAALGVAPEAFVPAALLAQLHELRVTKTPYEVECMAAASRVAARGHSAVAEAFSAGVRSELDLHMVYLMATEQDDHQAPYKNIVALGAHASTLHHVDYGEAPEAGSLLLDAGARHAGYCADITRTVAAQGGGDAARRFRALLAGMEALQAEVVAKVQVGLQYEALHDASHDLMGRLLVDTGLSRISAEAAVETGLTRVLFPHGLGHSLGIQVHDVGCRLTEPRPENKFLRNTRTIAPGQVFTIEPGLYFIDALLAEARAGAHADSLDWALVDALRPFGGIRVEDNVVVLPEGSAENVRNLTREAFE